MVLQRDYEISMLIFINKIIKFMLKSFHLFSNLHFMNIVNQLTYIALKFRWMNGNIAWG